LLFEEFLEWFGGLSKEDKLSFGQQQTTSDGYSERARELNYYTMEKARAYFEEIIWPQRVEEKTQNMDKLLKQQEEIKEKQTKQKY
jgi:hypothetical protein